MKKITVVVGLLLFLISNAESFGGYVSWTPVGVAGGVFETGNTDSSGPFFNGVPSGSGSASFQASNGKQVHASAGASFNFNPRVASGGLTNSLFSVSGTSDSNSPSSILFSAGGQAQYNWEVPFGWISTIEQRKLLPLRWTSVKVFSPSSTLLLVVIWHQVTQ